MVFSKTQRIVFCALFTALSTVATMVIQIPSPMSGYVNLGDAFVLLGAFLLGPIYGTIAGGLGPMLADLLTGYAIYAPATLVIKCLMAFVGWLLYATLSKAFKFKGAMVIAVVVAGIVSELIMVAGYFLYAALIMTEGWAAAASIPGNLMQGLIGVVASTMLFLAIKRIKLFKDQ